MSSGATWLSPCLGRFLHQLCRASAHHGESDARALLLAGLHPVLHRTAHLARLPRRRHHRGPLAAWRCRQAPPRPGGNQRGAIALSEAEVTGALSLDESCQRRTLLFSKAEGLRGT